MSTRSRQTPAHTDQSRCNSCSRPLKGERVGLCAPCIAEQMSGCVEREELQTPPCGYFSAHAC